MLNLLLKHSSQRKLKKPISVALAKTNALDNIKWDATRTSTVSQAPLTPIIELEREFTKPSDFGSFLLIRCERCMKQPFIINNPQFLHSTSNWY
jgi:hypothetical protein